ncbi:putative membrane protein [Kibdelosporangium banguiense]|uniref:Membrane protein n=1 Tax=Kibdelosporangium banguiense TaxID=1365924 RepID=A0ABS4T5F8_9PSEU|nr:CD225/dispanin family protein [Kibdelosporangium banguiense]MBP2319682.1 putative membrane protein [Kibdelosporangium banguiense]
MSQPYGQPHAQYAPQQQGNVTAPPNYLVWSIVSIFLFWPLAIAAIIKSTSVDRLWAEGRPEEAQQASKTAKTLNVVALVLGILAIVLAVVLVITTAATVSQLPNVDFDVK